MRTASSLPDLDVLLARLDRRAVLKATAAFGAMAAAGGVVVNRSVAHEAPSRAEVWRDADATANDDGSVTFASDFPFTAVAPHWDGATSFPAAVEISLSEDGERFSDPVVVGPSLVDAGPPDRDRRFFGDLVLTPAAGHVRYRAVDADGNTTTIPDLSLTYIDASTGPSIDAFGQPLFYARATRPPIISRAEWGAGLAYGGEDQGWSAWPPDYQTVEHVIIHHSETPRFRDPLIEVRSIHYYHAIVRGWGDIGYNYLVDFMGNVYEGRVGGENAIGGHAFQFAHGSCGICCMGSFSRQNATPEAMAGLIWIVAWASRKLNPWGRKDFHEIENLPTICAHRDVWNSSCPGDELYDNIDGVRAAVADVQVAGVDYPNPGYTAGDVVEVNVGRANLRSGPSTGFRVVAQLGRGTLMTVIDGPTTASGFTWYKLRGRDSEGWASTTVIDPSNRKAIASFGRGDRVVITTDRLNLRAEPSLRAEVRGVMPTNATATVREGPRRGNGYTWYRVESKHGAGWAVEQYLSRGSARSGGSRGRGSRVGDTMIVNTESLRLRSRPDTDASIVAVLPLQRKVTVVGGPRREDNYDWLEVETKEGRGWCVAYLLLRIKRGS